MPRRSAVKSVAPLVFAIIFVPVAYAVMWMMLSFGFSQLQMPWQLYYGVPVLLVSTVLGLCSWTLLRLERIDNPGVLDHLRHCALLYVVLASLGFLLFSALDRDDTDTYAVPLVVFVCAAYAIAVDASILILKRLRSGRTGRGSET